MNLNISPVNSMVNQNNVSFGMARFTRKGYQMARTHADIFESLGHPNYPLNPDFFKPKNWFSKTPFTKYYIKELNGKKDARAVARVADTIVRCGATDNNHSNYQFILQLIDTESNIHRSDNYTKKKIGEACNSVFKKNWDNPELTKEETFRLLDLARYDMDDRVYQSLTAAIQNSDMV